MSLTQHSHATAAIVAVVVLLVGLALSYRKK